MKFKVLLKITIFLTVSYCTGLYAQSTQMIAEITEPVVTEFGTYLPNPVNINPSIPDYSVAPDFSNVTNFADFTFSNSELEILRNNHFLVTPSRASTATGYKEMYDIYNECRELGIPILITTDAMLHTFHLCFDFILKTCEEKRFIVDLDLLLNALLNQATNDYQNATATIAHNAATINLNYLLVAKALLDTTYDVNNNVLTIAERLYDDELALIYPAEQMDYNSPIFAYKEDYTQYKPRGHYTQSDSLKHYFRSMMWLGRMTFDITYTDRTLAALLLTKAMKTLEVNGRSAQEVWEDIYSPTVFFVGKSDDITFITCDSLAVLVYGADYTNLSVNALSDTAKLAEFMALLDGLPDPKITSGPVPKGFRLMGQRFIPDSWVLDELVYDKVADRYWPTGLDVMTVLGSERAHVLLEDERLSFPDYAIKLDYLRNEFENYPASTWAQNLYWNWLYCLMPLLFEKGEGFPAFMKVAAWLDKDLFAALGSWAELRHDTILYAKQSGTEVGMKPMSWLTQGYVEPNPWFYARLASLADFLVTGLDSRDLLFTNFKKSLEDLEELLLNLKTISEKELTNQFLTTEEYELICNIGETLETIAEFLLWPTAGPDFSSDDEMPVIADVHTEHNSGWVLEEAVGYPYSIYAICRIEGDLKIVKGAGFSYYEFKSPERLTDEAWTDMLIAGNEPNHPEWSCSFIPSDTWHNSNPECYMWTKQGMSTLSVELSTDSVQVGDSVVITLTSTIQFTGAPQLTIFSDEGTNLGSIQVTPVTGGYTGTITTNALPTGRTWINIEASLIDIGLFPGTINYRTGFDLYKAGSVDENETPTPLQFALFPNYPNPFNPFTRLTYQIPEQCTVEVSIYNIQGRIIRKLVSTMQPAGEHSVIWDGCDDEGDMVGTGIYYVHLSANSRNVAQKVLLIR